MEKHFINNQEELDSLLHFLIGGSWDGMKDKYPLEYPCIFFITKDRQTMGYMYKEDFDKLNK